MAQFVSVHVISCMTRQDLQRLVKRMAADTESGVRFIRLQGDTVSARMVCEWEATDRDTLVAWLEKHNIRFRGNEEWVMKVQWETSGGPLQPIG